MRTGAARGYVGNFHEAGFYGSDGEFLALIVPFVTDGLAAREPVIIGYDARKCDLLRASLPRPSAVQFITDKSLYASPARAIDAYRRQFERHLTGGAAQIRIAGDVPHEGNGGRFEGWDRYESAVNTVWQDYPVWSRCLYDATTVPDDVRDVVERTHPRIVTAAGEAGASRRYQDVTEFRGLQPTADPLEESPPSVEVVGASAEEVRNRLALVAHGRVGTSTVEDLLFGVSEAVLNAELYGRPPITVRIWAAPGRLVVHVHDSGPGPVNPLAGLVPAADGGSGAGLGLWLTHQLNNLDVSLIRAADGFTVRLRGGRLPDRTDTLAGRIAPRAGTAFGAPPNCGDVHAIDGDGSSFCNVVDAARLTQLDGLLWPDVAREQRCRECQLVMTYYGMGQF